MRWFGGGRLRAMVKCLRSNMVSRIAVRKTLSTSSLGIIQILWNESQKGGVNRSINRFNALFVLSRYILIESTKIGDRRMVNSPGRDEKGCPCFPYYITRRL